MCPICIRRFCKRLAVKPGISELIRFTSDRAKCRVECADNFIDDDKGILVFANTFCNNELNVSFPLYERIGTSKDSSSPPSSIRAFNCVKLIPCRSFNKRWRW